MGADINKIINNLNEFYNLTDKKIIHVGIGKGLFTGYSNLAKKVFAYDNNPDIEKDLLSKLQNENTIDRYVIRISDFSDCKDNADLVFFEFCLHEIENPNEALEFAKGISNNILIIDHSKFSKWSYYTLESDKLEKSWSAINNFEYKKHKAFDEYQFFNDFSELKDKLSVLGDECMKRIKEFENESNIKIYMPYEICLI